MKYYLTEAGSKLFNPVKRKQTLANIKYFFNRKRDTARAEGGEKSYGHPTQPPSSPNPDPTKFDSYKGQGHSGPKVVIRKK